MAKSSACLTFDQTGTFIKSLVHVHGPDSNLPPLAGFRRAGMLYNRLPQQRPHPVLSSDARFSASPGIPHALRAGSLAPTSTLWLAHGHAGEI